MSAKNRAWLDKVTARYCFKNYTIEWPCQMEKGHAGECGGSQFVWPRKADPRSLHDWPTHLDEDVCRCGSPAAHKVEETSGAGTFHPLSNYLCCGCFTQVIGNCGGIA